MEKQILDNYITNKQLDRSSYWKNFQYLRDSDSSFVKSSPKNITAAELLVTNIDSFQRQEIRLQEQIGRLVSDLNHTKNEKNDLQSAIDSLQNKLSTVLVQKEEAESFLRDIQIQYSTVKQESDNRLFEYKKLENRLKDEQTRSADLVQQCQDLTKQIDKQHDDIVSNLNEQVQKLNEKCQELEKEKRKLKLDTELSTQNYNTLVEKSDRDLDYKTKELEMLKNQLKEEQSKSEKLENENGKLKEQLEKSEQDTKDILTYKEENDKLSKEISELNVNQLETSKQLDDLNVDLSNKETQLNNLKEYLNQTCEKNEELDKKLNNILKKWNEERNKYKIKEEANDANNNLDVNNGSSSSESDLNLFKESSESSLSLENIPSNTENQNGDTVYFDENDNLVVKEIKLVDSFEYSNSKREMMKELKKSKDEMEMSKSLYLETDRKYQDCVKKLEKTETKLKEAVETQNVLKERVNYIKQVYGEMVKAVQTESRISIDTLKEKLDYTTESYQNLQKKYDDLEQHLKENSISEEMDNLLKTKETEIENLKNELQDLVEKTNRNDYLIRESQAKEKILN